MKLKRRTYKDRIEKAIDFGVGLFHFFVINNVLTCALVVTYRAGYMENYQPPFPIYATLWILGIVNILAFLYFIRTAHWVAFGMIGAIIVNELIWLVSGIHDPMTIIMPFWMGIGYD